MNSALLGDLVQIIRHKDESLVGKCGTITAVTNTTVSVHIEPNNQSTRQVPISDIEVLKKVTVAVC